MQENLNTWKQTTADLYKAVQIFTWAAVAAAIFSFFGSVGDVASTFSALADGKSSGSSFGFWDVLDILATAAIVYGYWLFITSLDIFKGQVHTTDAPRIGFIRMATILSVIGVVVALIPFAGFVGGILNLIAWIMLLVAYSNLKNSVTFPEGARRGASKLFMAMVIGIIGWVIGLIPLVGDAIETVLEIIAFFIVLSGWKSISESEEPAIKA